jgi:hypothetical protein
MGRIRWIALAVVALVIATGVAVFAAEHPKLDDARSAADRSWKQLPTLTGGLVARYHQLEGALSAFDNAGGRGRPVSLELHAGLQTWERALNRGDPGDQVTAANALEAEGNRLHKDVLATDRFSTVKALTDAVAAFIATRPVTALVDAYNNAARQYEKVRTSVLARPLARTFGYGPRALFVVAAG